MKSSYCIQGTKTVKILNLKKMSQSSEQIIIDLSEWSELESKRIWEFRKNFLEKKNDSYEKYFDEIVNLGYGNSFHLLANELLQQMTILEEIVEIDIFYRDRKKCFSPLSVFLLD